MLDLCLKKNQANIADAECAKSEAEAILRRLAAERERPRESAVCAESNFPARFFTLANTFNSQKVQALVQYEREVEDTLAKVCRQLGSAQSTQKLLSARADMRRLQLARANE